VADHRGRAEERGELPERHGGRRGAEQILVADAREPCDRGMQIDTGLDERAEALAHAHRALRLERETRGADLDDTVGGGIEARGLEVECDELYSVLDLAPHERRGLVRR
jgi:hypothetical protein